MLGWRELRLGAVPDVDETAEAGTWEVLSPSDSCWIGDWADGTQAGSRRLVASPLEALGIVSWLAGQRWSAMSSKLVLNGKLVTPRVPVTIQQAERGSQASESLSELPSELMPWRFRERPARWHRQSLAAGSQMRLRSPPAFVRIRVWRCVGASGSKSLVPKTLYLPDTVALLT